MPTPRGCRWHRELRLDTILRRGDPCLNSPMNATHIETKNLKLVLQSPEEVRAFIDGLDAHQKAEVSADWLARLAASTQPDPWVHGFAMLHRIGGATVGNVAFKGPPSPDGVVEIA